MKIINKLLDRFILEDQNPEEVFLIKTTIITIFILTLNLLLLGGLLFYFEYVSAGFIAIIFAILEWLNIIIFAFTKNWKLFRFIFFLLGILLPSSLQTSLGGYLNSGSIILWGILLVAWLAMIEDTKLKYIWLVFFVITAIVLAVFDLQISLIANSISDSAKKILIMNMLIGIVIPLFFLMDFNQSKLRKEKKRSDDLLHNILPHETVLELKSTGTTQAKSYESVTVLFTDFKGFTKIAENLPPEEIVQKLDYCFTQFDLIAQKYGLEKIKPILLMLLMRVYGLRIVLTLCERKNAEIVFRFITYRR